jgi:hypothetical protein
MILPLTIAFAARADQLRYPAASLEATVKLNGMQLWSSLSPDAWESGAGTSKLARRLRPMLPTMTLGEAIETTRIHRVAGLTDGRTVLVTPRPCRAPHHTISDVGLVGGG